MKGTAKPKPTTKAPQDAPHHIVIFQGLSGRRYQDMKAMVADGMSCEEVAAHFEVPTEYVETECANGIVGG